MKEFCMKKKKMKQGLLALACALTMMSAGWSAKAAETAGADDAYLSDCYTGSCGCVMKIETRSQRSLTDNGNETHTVVYNTTYVCSHDLVNRTETIKESHVFSGDCKDAEHDTKDDSIHLYMQACRCGAMGGETIRLTCHGNINGGYHAQP